MKAIITKKYGSPDVLELQEVAQPIPKEKEVLIKVYATTVNRTDCANRSAKPFIMRFVVGLFKPKKTIQGTDFSGQVAAVGSAVSNYKVGDRVFGFDDTVLSSHAEYLSIATKDIKGTIPENISYEEMAACIEGLHYAFNSLNKLSLKPGQKVLVNGATGAIGSATVQLLKYYELDITATANTKNIALVKSLGATQVIDYLKSDFTKLDQQFDYVLDTVGKSSFNQCKPILKEGGIYISSELGWMAQNLFYALFTPLFSKKKVIFPIPNDTTNGFQLVQELLTNGQFKAVIDRTYPLEEIADAYRYVETGEKTGNVVVVMN